MSSTAPTAVPREAVLAGGYHHPLLRSLQAERHLVKDMLMYPIFITDEPDAVVRPLLLLPLLLLVLLVLLTSLTPPPPLSPQVDIKSLPGQKRWGINKLEAFLAPLVNKGLRSVILFGVPLHMAKDGRGSPADDPSTPVILATHLIRDKFPDLVVACDVCLCEYTDHGHCGELCPLDQLTPAEQRADAKVIDNPRSVRRMQDVALAYARAGAHMVAPSDMMDGRVGAIKQALVDNGFGNRCSLMAYSAKFASNMYGPFRCATLSLILPRRARALRPLSSQLADALDGALAGKQPALCPTLATASATSCRPTREASPDEPSCVPPSSRTLTFSPRSLTLVLSISSLTVSLLPAQVRDAREGADFLMVKPALPYLDIMRDARELAPDVPLACYQVSGEFAMIHAGANAGVYDLKAMALESAEGFLRAGASSSLSFLSLALSLLVPR